MNTGRLKIATNANLELINITDEIDSIVAGQTISSGIVHLFNPHTTAGLIINEGADPDVRRDILHGLTHMVPGNLTFHHAEGNSPAHIMAMLAGCSLTIFIDGGRLQLGTWQKIFFCEFDGPRSRSIRWKIVADAR
jgi:secondary thiamine-phosphate synthase enzyme